VLFAFPLKEIVNVTFEQWDLRKIMPVSFTGISIPFDSHPDLKSGQFNAFAETATAGKKGYRG
jgi:hypothetical protein